MLAITVTMVAVAAPLVLTQSESVVDEQPDVDIAFSYTEDVDESQQDVFEADGSVVGEDGGLLTVTVETGEAVPAGQLEVQGAASSGNLVADGTFEDGERVASGTAFTVWVNRGETVRLIWTAPEGDEGAVLAEFTVRPAP